MTLTQTKFFEFMNNHNYDIQILKNYNRMGWYSSTYYFIQNDKLAFQVEEKRDFSNRIIIPNYRIVWNIEINEFVNEMCHQYFKTSYRLREEKKEVYQEHRLEEEFLFKYLSHYFPKCKFQLSIKSEVANFIVGQSYCYKINPLEFTLSEVTNVLNKNRYGQIMTFPLNPEDIILKHYHIYSHFDNFVPYQQELLNKICYLFYRSFDESISKRKALLIYGLIEPRDFKKIGQQVRALRHKENASKSRFASSLNVKVEELQSVENGEARPSFSFLMKLADYMNRDLITLLESSFFIKSIHDSSYRLKKTKVMRDISKLTA